jgi:uncharacterized protein YukE
MTSNAFQGMNIDVITSTVAPGLTQQAGAIREVIIGVERQITLSEENWKGPDSQQFANKWRSEYQNPLRQLAEELDNLAAAARSNAAAQQGVSSQLNA